MEKNVLNFSIAFLVLSGVFFAGCATDTDTGNGPNTEFREMERFESLDDLIASFKDAQANARQWGVFDKALGSIGGIAMPMMATSVASEGASGSPRGGSDDFSTTNIQVEGVDEADIVKTDGEFIYNFSNTRLIITRAFPLEEAEIVLNKQLEDVFPQEMFVLENRLLLFGTKSYYDGRYPVGKQMGILPYPRDASSYFSPTAIVQLYDISDRSDIKLEKELEFEGSYLTSRLIGDNAYFVVNSYPRYYPQDYATPDEKDGFIPLMAEDGVARILAEPTDIAIIRPMPPQSFVTIASLNLESEKLQKETIAGSAQSVFASEQNIYLASTVWLPPETPVVKDVERIIAGDSEKTVVNKFGLVDGKIGFVGQGSVLGHVLNQFSMDEFEGNFRIATTVGQVWDTLQQSQNNLFVLDEEMHTIGSLENLAPGEKIYSARFMGNRAYMVTFKKVDPLFVIDVSEPTNPRVLGKLKIPGYSDYLHPIDETHLIGIGKDTIEASDELVQGRGFDFAWYQGLKMAVFDVSDVVNPKEMHKIVIGDRGTDSYALQDHKAFLYDKEKDLLVLPIMLAEIPAEQKRPLGDEMRSPSYGVPVFQGAFVYKLTLEAGFEERGRITHLSEEDELKRGYYYGNDYSVKRALFIGNVLYTLSEKMLKANDLDSLHQLKEFIFN